MQKRNGFTLLELLVVIAIIGILSGIVGPRLLGAMNGAKEQHCRNNLRQLQAAVVDYASDCGGDLPYAQSYEVYQVGDGTYHERRGWVSWVPSDRDIATLDSLWSEDPHVSHSGELKDDLGCGADASFAIEYGTLFEYVGDVKSYFCPVTERNPKKWVSVLTGSESTNKVPAVHRTYAMNPFFGAPTVRHWDARKITHIGVSQTYSWKNEGGKNAKSYSYLPEADKLLLFSETFPEPTGKSVQRNGFNDSAQGGDHSYDCCVNPHVFDSASERIMGLHGEEKPTKVEECSALAVFFDGHIEKVTPIAEEGTGNSAWFFNRGLRPAKTDPTR
jgi:prepilin-type N-terminal cleavage/methylation domain-containing protein